MSKEDTVGVNRKRVISTHSGIPDFARQMAAYGNDMDPTKSLRLASFRYHPEKSFISGFVPLPRA